MNISGRSLQGSCGDTINCACGSSCCPTGYNCGASNLCCRAGYYSCGSLGGCCPNGYRCTSTSCPAGGGGSSGPTCQDIPSATQTPGPTPSRTGSAPPTPSGSPSSSQTPSNSPSSSGTPSSTGSPTGSPSTTSTSSQTQTSTPSALPLYAIRVSFELALAAAPGPNDDTSLLFTGVCNSTNATTLNQAASWGSAIRTAASSPELATELSSRYATLLGDGFPPPVEPPTIAADGVSIAILDVAQPAASKAELPIAIIAGAGGGGLLLIILAAVCCCKRGGDKSAVATGPPQSKGAPPQDNPSFSIADPSMRYLPGVVRPPPRASFQPDVVPYGQSPQQYPPRQ